MRNFFKPTTRGANARSRRPLRGVAATVASVALVAGLGGYPGDAVAQEATTAASSAAETPAEPSAEATSNPTTAEGVTVERSGDVDTIVVDDSDVNVWDSGRKASDEDIIALKRTGEGTIEEIIKVVADGKKLDPQYYGFVNDDNGGYIAVDMDGLNVTPPMHIEYEVRTTEAAEYDIAESDEVPTARELSASGFGQTENDAATVNPDGVGKARAATQSNSQIPLVLNSPSYKNTKPASGDTAPRGKLSTSIGGTYAQRDVHLTELVLTHNNASARYSLSGPIVLTKNNGTETCTIQSSNIKNLSTRTAANGGSVSKISVDLSSCNPQIIVWQGSGDTIDIDFNGPSTANAQSYYSLELYGSYTPGKSETPGTTTPGSPDPGTPNPQPNPDMKERFRIEGRGGIQMSPSQSTGTNPYQTTSTVSGDSTFTNAIVRVSAPNSLLAVENYKLEVDQIEPGVTFGRRAISVSKDYVEFEVYPMKDGKKVDSVQVPNGAKFTATSKFSDNPQIIDAVTTIYGKSNQPPTRPTTPVAPPDGADWVHKQVPNPEMPQKCGLKIAIVADQSRSLSHADTDGFKASRDAATGLVNALKGATGTQVGVYTFATTRGTSGTTGGPVPVQDANGSLNPKITNAINEWTPQKTSGKATNWEDGLEQVQGQGYDVVYFITDGMPTHDNDGWQIDKSTGQLYSNAGGYTQERSLNRAIDEANKLKQAGTRVVPIMVDLTMLAGNVIERDYVLKNVLPSSAAESAKNAVERDAPVFIHQGTKSNDSPNFFHEEYKRTVYRNPEKIPSIVNVEEAYNAPKNSYNKKRLMGFYYNKDYGPDSIKFEIPADKMSLWTHGLRGVKQMGEDISGPGDTVRVREYSQLAAQLKQIGDELNRLCEGKIIVQKRIVDSQGNVKVNGANDWDFSIISGRNVLDLGNDQRGTSDTKRTAKTADGEGTVSWTLKSTNAVPVTVNEHQKDGYKLYQRDKKNAKCTQTLNGVTQDLAVENSGATGFRVNVNAQDNHLATVTCTVDNFKEKEVNVKLRLAKVSSDKLNSTDVLNNANLLKGAEFTLTPMNKDWVAMGAGTQLGFDQGTGTFFSGDLTPGNYRLSETRAPAGYSLLTRPIDIIVTAPASAEASAKITFRNPSGVEVIAKSVDQTKAPKEWKLTNQDAVLTLANVLQGDLPKTGGRGVGVTTALGLLIAAAGALMANSRRRV